MDADKDLLADESITQDSVTEDSVAEGSVTKDPVTQDSTRNRILKSARHCFASTGFAETSVKTIAQQADVNPALIHYHFGSKEALYREALRDGIASLTRRVSSRIDVGIPPEETLLLYLTHLMEALRCEPDIAGLLRQDLGRGGRVAREAIEMAASGSGQNLMTMAEQLLCAAQDAGRIRRLPPEAVWRLLGTIAFGGVLLGSFTSRTTEDRPASWEPYLETIEILFRQGLLTTSL